MKNLKDYYSILGVSENATSDDIKRAYRRLAKKYHPDINKDPDAESKFKEIQEAYDVLSDERTRREYDARRKGFGGGWTGNMGGGRTGRGVGDDFFRINIEDLFGAGRGDWTNDWDPIESAFGFGGSRFGGSQRITMKTSMKVSLEELYNGTTKSINLINGNKRSKIEIQIPPRTPPYSVIEYTDEEGKVVRIIHIKLEPTDIPNNIEVDDSDIVATVPVPFYYLIDGGRIEVNLFKGLHVRINIPPDTYVGDYFVIKEKGFRKEDGRFGNLYIKADITIPNLDPFEQKLIKALAKRKGREASSEEIYTMIFESLRDEYPDIFSKVEEEKRREIASTIEKEYRKESVVLQESPSIPDIRQEENSRSKGEEGNIESVGDILEESLEFKVEGVEESKDVSYTDS